MLSLTPFSNVFSKSFGPSFEVFDSFQHELERLFDRPGQGRFPAVNLWSNDDEAIVTAELPGFSPEDVEVAVEDGHMILKGERKGEESGDKYQRQERWSGRFERSFKLPFAVDADKVEAHFDKGVLEVKLPRREADKPRKIAVKVS